jgi:DNA-binding XRE family transcriptional regulator
MTFRFYRDRAGLTQEAVAKHFDVDRTTVSKWEQEMVIVKFDKPFFNLYNF